MKPRWPFVVAAAAALAAVAWWRRGSMVDLAPAFSVGFSKRKTPPRYLVLHQSATSSPQSTLAVLRAKGISTHFEISRDGTIYRYLDPATSYAWHSGSSWANRSSIGIDLTHRPGEDWPATQIAAARQLCDELRAQFGIAPGIAADGVLFKAEQDVPANVGILRHRNVRPGGTACPGDLPMAALAPAWGLA